MRVKDPNGWRDATTEEETLIKSRMTEQSTHDRLKALEKLAGLR